MTTDTFEFAIWQYDLRTSMEKKYKVKETELRDFQTMQTWTEHSHGLFTRRTTVEIRNKVTLRFAAESK